MRYGKWWVTRRLTFLLILALFLVSARSGVNVLVGNYSGSTFLGVIPAVDPLLAIQSYFATGGLYQTAIIGAVLVGALYLVVGGRAFCGWVCPLGVVVDFANWLSRKLKIKRPFQGFSSSTKYYMMGIVLVGATISGVALYEMYNPVSILHRAILFEGVGIGAVSWMIVGILFLYELGVARSGWCKSLCPQGAFYSTLGKFSLMKVVANEGRGSIPKNIGEVCPEPAALVNILNHERQNGECTLCGACVDYAGNGSLSFTLKPGS